MANEEILRTPAGEPVALYLFDDTGEARVYTRRDGRVDVVYKDDLPEDIYEWSPEGVFLVWAGEIVDPRALSEAECDEKGIPYEESRKFEDWWLGKMRPATDAEILAVFSNESNALPLPEDARTVKREGGGDE